MIALALGVLLAAELTEKPRLVVLDLTPVGTIDASIVRGLTDSLTQEVGRVGLFKVMSAKEIETALGISRQKQLLGCNDDTTCLSELAGALGARFVMTGSVARFGSGYQLSVQTIDTQKVQPLGRSNRVARDLATLRSQVPVAVADATASPRPSPPSRLLPYSLMGLGVAALVAGGLFGYLALTDESSLSRELELGQTQSGVLKPATYYDEAGRRLGLQKTLSLVGLIAGAALLAGGLVFYRLAGDGAESDSDIAVWFGPTSATLVAHF